MAQHKANKAKSRSERAHPQSSHPNPTAKPAATSARPTDGSEPLGTAPRQTPAPARSAATSARPPREEPRTSPRRADVDSEGRRYRDVDDDATDRRPPAADPDGDERKVRSAGGRIRVRALRMGFYNLERRRVDDVFMVQAKEFNPSWMQRVAADVAIARTTGKEELRRKHDEILGAKYQAGVHTDEHDVPAGRDNPLDAE